MSNKYLKYSKLSEAQFRAILRLFCFEMDATKVAEFIGLNRLTVIGYFPKSELE